jgi:hypothetical protein
MDPATEVKVTAVAGVVGSNASVVIDAVETAAV